MKRLNSVRMHLLAVLAADAVLVPLVGITAYNLIFSPVARSGVKRSGGVISDEYLHEKSHDFFDKLDAADYKVSDDYDFLENRIDEALQPIPYSENPFNTNTVERNETGSDYKIDSFEGESEKSLLARVILGEGENCTLDEKYQIGFVAYNRANDHLKHNGVGLEDALIGKKHYFSSFHDINAKKMKDPETYAPEIFQDCLKVAEDIIEGKVQDPTNGANVMLHHNAPERSYHDRMEKLGRLKTSEGLSLHKFYQES